MPPLEAVTVLVSTMMSVGWSSKERHYDISRAHFQGTAQRLINVRLPAEDRQKYGEDKSWQIDQEHVRNSRCFSHLATWLRELDLYRTGRIPKMHAQCSIVPPRKLGCVSMAVHGDDFVCLSDDDGLKHIDSLLNSKIHSARHGNTWIRRFGYDVLDSKQIKLDSSVTLNLT